MIEKQKRIGVTVPLELWKRFKSQCFWELKTMQEVLLEQIEEFTKRKEDDVKKADLGQ